MRSNVGKGKRHFVDKDARVVGGGDCAREKKTVADERGAGGETEKERKKGQTRFRFRR